MNTLRVKPQVITTTTGIKMSIETFEERGEVRGGALEIEHDGRVTRFLFNGIGELIRMRLRSDEGTRTAPAVEAPLTDAADLHKSDASGDPHAANSEGS